jgi:hypothetical protein
MNKGVGEMEVFMPVQELKPVAARKSPKQIKASPKKSEIPASQWTLPAGYKADGQFATLKDVLAPDVHTLSLTEMTPEQKRNLVAARINAQPKYNLMTLGAGEVNKEQAVSAVKAGTPLGRTLIEVEERYLGDVMRHAATEAKV